MPIVIVDATGTLIYWNEPAELLLGLRFEESGEIPASEWREQFVVTDVDRQLIPHEEWPLVIALTRHQPVSRTIWVGTPERYAGVTWNGLRFRSSPRAANSSACKVCSGRSSVVSENLAAMQIQLCGTRGSLATPGPDTARYGGNTSCVSVIGREGTLLILDAGTGIRRLGATLPANLVRVDILLTHLHMDHVQGLGFFAPLYRPDFEVHIWGPASATLSLQARLMRYLSPPLFPVHLSELPCKLSFHAVPCGQVKSASSR